MNWSRRRFLFALAGATSQAAGCAFGLRPSTTVWSPDHGVVGATAEERLLRDIVRLRYTDTLPDDSAFARPLLTPLAPEWVAAQIQAGWPISTVFRLWYGSLNQVPNAETAAGPTPRTPPEYAGFLTGVTALQRLQDRGAVTLTTVEREDQLSDPLPDGIAGTVAVPGAGLKYRETAAGGRVVVRTQRRPALRFDGVEVEPPNFIAFCRAFRLDTEKRTFELTTGKLDPFLARAPAGGLGALDVETRSPLQVLFFLAHGVEVPPAHMASSIAPLTVGTDGAAFDWQQVLSGLFKVHWADGEKPPPAAHVAVRHRGYWFFIDSRDRDTQTTFALLAKLSRLDLKAQGRSGR